jgi:hypothetical protein
VRHPCVRAPSILRIHSRLKLSLDKSMASLKSPPVLRIDA